MRAQFVRGVDPKDSMNIGNKHAREAQKLIAAFKEINPNLNPRITDDKTEKDPDLEIVVVSISLDTTGYHLAWVDSGLEYYIAAWSKEGERGAQNTFPKLGQAKRKMEEYLSM